MIHAADVALYQRYTEIQRYMRLCQSELEIQRADATRVNGALCCFISIFRSHFAHFSNVKSNIEETQNPPNASKLRNCIVQYLASIVLSSILSHFEPTMIDPNTKIDGEVSFMGL